MMGTSCKKGCIYRGAAGIACDYATIMQKTRTKTLLEMGSPVSPADRRHCPFYQTGGRQGGNRQQKNEKMREHAIQLMKEGKNTEDVAQAVGVTAGTLQKWYRESEGTSRQRERLDAQNAARLQLYKQGMTDAEIADRVGVHTETIRWWRRQNGLKCNRADRKGRP